MSGNPAWRDKPLDECEIYMYVINVLALDGRYRTIGDIIDASDEELLSIPRFGAKSLAHVRRVIADEKRLATCIIQVWP